MTSDVVLQARNVTKTYPSRSGTGDVHALIDVDLAVVKGRTLGLVGESGSGKTTLTRMLLDLERPTAGEIRFEGADLHQLGVAETRRYRRLVGAVFQNPYSSLDPRMRIWDAVTEQLAIEKTADKKQRKARAGELLEIVGLGASRGDRFPHQLSGGQRQRVAIARALALDPEVIVLDEPLSALDVSVSAQIVNLLLQLQEDLGVTYVFVGHDLRLVKHLCHDLAVMYHGRLVEQGDAHDVLTAPAHPYTAALVAASELTSLELLAEDDDTTAPIDDVTVGCAYRNRCARAEDQCATVTPPPLPAGEGRAVRCHIPLRGPDREAALTPPP